MITLVFGPRGLPAAFRNMQGFGVNTYKWVNEAGETVLVKYHWLPKEGVKSWTAADAAAVQAQELGQHSKDLYEAIEAGDYPEWELCVQMMSDDEHAELDWDPLDDTKVWPENDFPVKPVGRMVLNRNATNFFAENEQIAFGTGVLVDGLDFSDDKMLVGRTFSYSDTQRYRVGPNYLQLPVNRPKVDGPHEPAGRPDGPRPRQRRREPARQLRAVDHRRPARGRVPAHDEQGPVIEGRLTRKRIAAHRGLQAGRRAVPALGAVGEGRPRRQLRRAHRRSATARSRSAWSGTSSSARTSSASASARASGSARTTSATSAAAGSDARRRGPGPPGQPRQQRLA